MDRKNLMFSLDIGTRNIIGIVGEFIDDGKFNILAYSIKEHDKRNMYDGQIHNIEGVTKVVKKIKEDLEEQIGTSLNRVSIAAAGRSLKTSKIKIDKTIDSSLEIDRNMVEVLELEAVQKAQDMINADKNTSNLKYYNIGYTIMNYYLEDNIMGKLEGHRGEEIGVKLIATFLPQIVVEGLYSVISKAGLEVSSITLEPIAAINVAIKEELRLLNLALIDIGAGTSDIAITQDGQIMAYAMTSTAGDEITETLSKKYLLDFNSSEALKTKLSSEDDHEFTDIVGITYNLTTKEIVANVYDIVNKISEEIAGKIIEYNGKAPNAVFIIGGSSQMPGLKECLADKLGLPKERVSIRDTSFIEGVEGITEDINGPDIVTPIGIAMEGISQNYNNFLQVKFNGEEIRTFNTENIKVSDILILNNYKPRNLIPQSGDDLVYFLNEERQAVSGKEGNPAEIYVNNEVANLNTSLKNNDEIKIIKGTKGEKPSVHIFDCISKEKIVYFNDEKYNLIKSIKLNGINVKENTELKENDRIEVCEYKTLGDFISFLQKNIRVDNVLINGDNANKNTILKTNDIITIEEKDIIKLIINKEEKVIKYNKKEFLFVDIFDHIDFDLTKPKGSLVLKLNGEDAEYMEPLKDYDVIQLFWEK